MTLFTLEKWPILVVCSGMIAAAVIDWWKFKVPNKLTFPLIISGWLLGLANNFGLGAGFNVEAGNIGGIGAAIAGTFLAMGLLIPVYAIGGMGAGDVKMTMGFGAWIGAFYGFGEGQWIIIYSFCAGCLVGGIIALFMILFRGQYKQNMEMFRAILGDLGAVPKEGIGAVADQANARRPRWHRLPYGVPLCIGFIGYLIYWNGGL